MHNLLALGGMPNELSVEFDLNTVYGQQGSRTAGGFKHRRMTVNRGVSRAINECLVEVISIYVESVSFCRS